MVGLSNSVYVSCNCLFCHEVFVHLIIQTNILLLLSFTAVVDLKGLVEAASHRLVVLLEWYLFATFNFLTFRHSCF